MQIFACSVKKWDEDYFLRFMIDRNRIVPLQFQCRSRICKSSSLQTCFFRSSLTILRSDVFGPLRKYFPSTIINNRNTFLFIHSRGRRDAPGLGPVSSKTNVSITKLVDNSFKTRRYFFHATLCMKNVIIRIKPRRDRFNRKISTSSLNFLHYLAITSRSLLKFYNPPTNVLPNARWQKKREETAIVEGWTWPSRNSRRIPFPKSSRFDSSAAYEEKKADFDLLRGIARPTRTENIDVEKERKREAVCVCACEREREKPGQEVDQRGVWERRRGIISEPASAIIHRPFEFSALVITTNTRQMNRGRVKERGKGGGKTARANREKKRGIAGEKEERRTAWLMESPRRARAPPG